MEKRQLEHKQMCKRTWFGPKHPESEDEIFRAFAESKRRGTEVLIQQVMASPIAQYRLRGPEE